MNKIIFAALAFVLIPAGASASVLITNVSVNPSTVEPGATTTLSVEVNRLGSQCDNNWVKTKVTIDGVETEYDMPTPDLVVGTGISASTTEITAPLTDGDYDVVVKVIRGPEQGLNCNENVGDVATTTLKVQTPTPPAPKDPASTGGGLGTRIERKLCNLLSLFGWGICPEPNPQFAPLYMDFYDRQIEILKSQ